MLSLDILWPARTEQVDHVSNVASSKQSKFAVSGRQAESHVRMYGRCGRTEQLTAEAEVANLLIAIEDAMFCETRTGGG